MTSSWIWRAIQAGRAGVLLTLVATGGCQSLLGIEQLIADDGDASDGAQGGADSSVDSTPRDGSGNEGSVGDSGRDATGADATFDVATPPADAIGDGSGDRSADVPLDASVDSRPDGGADALIADAVTDVSSPDSFQPDGASGDSAPSDGKLPDVSDANVTEAGTDSGPTPDAPIGDASSDRPPTITVQGRIIDYWRHVVPNVPVTIGATTVNTDANGQFTITGVAAPYDVAFTVTTIANNTPASYGWLYKGLTRVDPTLQVWDAFPNRSTNEFTIHVTGIDFANYPSEQLTIVAHGGSDGAFYSDMSNANSIKPTYWYGPTTSSMTGHALTWLRASSSFSALPTSYLSYDTQTASLTDMGSSSVSFDLTSRSIPSGTISGTATPSGSGGVRQNGLYVRFASNANILVVTDPNQPTSFSYLVPSVAGGTITLAASEGYLTTPPYAVVHRDDLAAGQTGIALSIPTASSINSPAGGTTGVNASTLFQWSGSAKVFVWSLLSDPEYKSIFVVTTEKQGTIPALPAGPTLPPGGSCHWYVETHGTFQSVDEATGTEGLLDDYGTGEPWGAWRGNGSFTRSAKFAFTTAP